MVNGCSVSGSWLSALPALLPLSLQGGSREPLERRSADSSSSATGSLQSCEYPVGAVRLRRRTSCYHVFQS